MERVWRKVNQGLSSKSKASSAVNQSTDTVSSAGFGETRNVAAVATVSSGLAIGNSTPTGRRLATSGQQSTPVQNVSFSQHVISTTSSERRRKKRRKSRPRRNGDRSGSNSRNNTSQHPTDSIKPENTPSHTKNNAQHVGIVSTTKSSGSFMPPLPPLPTQIATTTIGGTSDPSLRKRAVAKLRLFNFHLNWDLHMTQCKPCGPRSNGNILTRRLCRNRRREDNELYRSNSFKFERFERRDGNDGVETLKKQISVCDDYSLPIDFVKKRPSSFDPCLADNLPDNWTAPSPLSEHVKFLDPPTIVTHPPQPVKLVEGYSDPKDSRKHLRPHHRRNRKDKRSNYSSDSSAPKSSAEDDNDSNKFPELNSPDSISEDLVRPLQAHKSPKRLPVAEISKRNPSPYYYSDLLKAKEENQETSDARQRQSTVSEPTQTTNRTNVNLQPYKKSVSLDVPEIEREVPTPKRYSITEDGVRIIRCSTPSTTTSEDSDCSECQKRREWHAKALALVRQTCNIPVENPLPDPNPDSDNPQVVGSSMPPHRLLGPAVCACTAPAIGDDVDEFFRPRSIFYVHQQGAHECSDCAVNVGSDKSTNTDLPEDEMSSGRPRQIYETAFDCKVARSDDDLDEIDRVTKHLVLLQADNGNVVEKPAEVERPKSSKSRLEMKRKKTTKSQATPENPTVMVTLAQNMEGMNIDSSVDTMNNTDVNAPSQTPIRRYTPSPPSTAPLPVKFPGKHDRDRFFMNSIRSAPNLPASNPPHSRLKDPRLPIEVIRHQQEVPTGSDGSIADNSYDPPPRGSTNRPRSVVLESGRVLELRKSQHGRPRRGRNYSSTESMATSSSGGSMESLRSSTSEGNRSTTSSESRHSTSLSSHSSDSSHNISLPLRAPVLIHSKLHILSPISDKSSQEPASETSELNHSRHNSSQKQSPTDEIHKVSSSDVNRPKDEHTVNEGSLLKQPKRKAFPNKVLMHLTEEMIGSDSGISLHSREDAKSSTQSAFHKFSLPKPNFALDKSEMSGQSVIGGTSGGGLPQDLRDLPFDMPKLRRRKFLMQQDNCTSGSATSVDLGDLPFDMPKLRRKLRMNQPPTTNLVFHSTESSGISQASSSHSVRDDQKQGVLGLAIANQQKFVLEIIDKLFLDTSIFRQNLTLNLNEVKPVNKFGSLDLKSASTRGLNLNIGNPAPVDLIDISIPLERQGWYHGAITRIDAENTLRPLSEGSFLVRNCESTKQDYSLSLKSAKGFMHMRIQRNESGLYILGQFSRPFESVPEMIRHFCLNRLPVRGAEHMCLIEPVIAQLL